MTKNLNLKILSLIGAIFLWIYVVATVNPTVDREYRNIDIVYKNVDSLYSKGLDIVGERDKKVNITVSGKTNDFIGVSESDIKAEVDLKDLDEKTETIAINFIVPTNLTVIDKSMTEVPISIEKVISKEVKVEIKQVGTPSDNLAVLVGTLIPETVVVEGARSLVERADKVIAIQDMSQISANTTRNVPILAVDAEEEELPSLKLSQNFVNVSFDTYKITNVPIKFVSHGQIPDGLDLLDRSLTQLEVAILMPLNSNAEIKEIETESFDLSQVSQAGLYDLKLKVPEGVRLRDRDLKLAVKFDLAKIISKTFEVDKSKLEVRNSAHPINEINPKFEGKLNISLTGSDKSLEKIKVEDIKPFINAEGLGRGYHNLLIEIDPIEGITAYRVDPERMGVDIRE